MHHYVHSVLVSMGTLVTAALSDHQELISVCETCKNYTYSLGCGGCGFDTGVLRLKKPHLLCTKLKGLGQTSDNISSSMMYISFICFQMSLLLNSLTRHKILTGNCRKWMIAVAFWVHGLLPLQYVAPHIKVTWWLCFYGNSRVEINISTAIFPVTTGSKWPYICLYH